MICLKEEAQLLYCHLSASSSLSIIQLTSLETPAPRMENTLSPGHNTCNVIRLTLLLTTSVEAPQLLYRHCLTSVRQSLMWLVLQMISSEDAAQLLYRHVRPSSGLSIGQLTRLDPPLPMDMENAEPGSPPATIPSDASHRDDMTSHNNSSSSTSSLSGAGDPPRTNRAFLISHSIAH